MFYLIRAFNVSKQFENTRKPGTKNTIAFYKAKLENTTETEFSRFNDMNKLGRESYIVGEIASYSVDHLI